MRQVRVGEGARERGSVGMNVESARCSGQTRHIETSDRSGAMGMEVGLGVIHAFGSQPPFLAFATYSISHSSSEERRSNYWEGLVVG